MTLIFMHDTTFKCKSLLKYKNVFNMQVVCNKTVLGEKILSK